MDVHKRTYSVALFCVTDGQVESWNCPADEAGLVEQLRRLGCRIEHIVYESGPTGFSLCRALRDAGFKASVIAASRIPSGAAAVAKSDRINATKLAIYCARGLLRPIAIPTIEDEGYRALVRRRKRLAETRAKLKQKIKGFLLAKGVDEPPSSKKWLRVRPETLCRITEFSEHESNGRELDEGERVAVEVLPVLGQSAAAVEPGDGAFDHPTPGLDDEALHPIGSLDDLGLEIGQDAGQGAVKDRPLIGAVGEQFPEKGKQTEQGRQQRETAVAILNVGGGDDAVQQQALRIDQNMPLLALDQLAGIEAVAVDASPPFSALFTL